MKEERISPGDKVVVIVDKTFATSDNVEFQVYNSKHKVVFTQENCLHRRFYIEWGFP